MTFCPFNSLAHHLINSDNCTRIGMHKTMKTHVTTMDVVCMIQPVAAGSQTVHHDFSKNVHQFYFRFNYIEDTREFQ